MGVPHLSEKISVGMGFLGRYVARYPVYFLIASSVLSALLAPGVWFLQYDDDFIKLSEVSGSIFKNAEVLLSNLFPMNSSENFDLLRIIGIPKGSFIYILNKNGEGVLNESVFEEIQYVDDIVRNISVKVEGNAMKYSEICAKSEGRCFKNVVIDLLPKIKDILSKRYRFKYPVDIPKTGFPVIYMFNLGGVTTDHESYVDDAMAVRLLYFTDASDVTKREYLQLWESSVADELQKRRFDSIEVYATVYSKFKEGTNKVSESFSSMAGIVGSLMVGVAILSLMTYSSVRSKPWLGAAATMSTVLAIVSSSGLASFIGVPFNFLNAVIPFLILGTEIDDAFLLIGAWRATNAGDSIEKRMEETFSRAGVSIMLTSLTSFLAYCVGIGTSVLLVKFACIHMAISVFFTYVYQLIFFGPCMALDGRREKGGRSSLHFFKVKGTEEDRGEEREILSVWISKYFGGLCILPSAKCITIAAFFLNLAFGIYGIYSLKIGSDPYQIIEPGSMLDVSIKTSKKYFSSFQIPLHVIVNQPMNYADKAVQEKIENILETIERHPHISGATISWLKYYKMFAELPVAKFSLGGFNLSDSRDFIDGLRYVFLNIRLFKQFKQDINFNEDFTQITSSRFILVANISFDNGMRLTRDISAIIENSGIPISVYSLLFSSTEQNLVIGDMAFRCLWITALIIASLFLIFTRRILHVIIVTICIVSSMVETVGYMTLWDVHLDYASTITLILSLGFSINYPTHFSYAFLTNKDHSATERVKITLHHVGLPIIQGSVTTVCAVAIFAFQTVKVYGIFFVVLSLIVVETAFHSLFVMPAVLSVISNFPPNPCLHQKCRSRPRGEIHSNASPIPPEIESP